MIFSGNFTFFAVWLLIFSQVQFVSFVRGKTNSTIEQQNCDRLLVSKVKFNQITK